MRGHARAGKNGRFVPHGLRAVLAVWAGPRRARGAALCAAPFFLALPRGPAHTAYSPCHLVASLLGRAVAASRLSFCPHPPTLPPSSGKPLLLYVASSFKQQRPALLRRLNMGVLLGRGPASPPRSSSACMRVPVGLGRRCVVLLASCLISAVFWPCCRAAPLGAPVVVPSSRRGGSFLAVLLVASRPLAASRALLSSGCWGAAARAFPLLVLARFVGSPRCSRGCFPPCCAPRSLRYSCSRPRFARATGERYKGYAFLFFRLAPPASRFLRGPFKSAFRLTCRHFMPTLPPTFCNDLKLSPKENEEAKSTNRTKKTRKK